MYSILRVWKLKTSIDFSHLLDLKAPGGPASNHAKGPGGPLKQTKHPRIGGFTCLEGSGRLNVSYFTYPEAQDVDVFFTLTLTDLRPRVGPLKQTKHPRIGGPRLGGSGRINLSYFTCLGGSERLNLLYFKCLERLQEVQPLTKLGDKVGPLKKDLTRAGGGEESGRLVEAESIVFYVSGKFWKIQPIGKW